MEDYEEYVENVPDHTRDSFGKGRKYWIILKGSTAHDSEEEGVRCEEKEMAKAGFNILKVFIVFRDKIANFNYHIKDLFSFPVN